MATATETSADVELHSLPSPQPAPPAPSVSNSRDRTSKLLSAGFSFFVAGINDGSIGALLPYFIRQYEISNAIVSAMCATPSLPISRTLFANTGLDMLPTSSAGWLPRWLTRISPSV